MVLVGLTQNKPQWLCSWWRVTLDWVTTNVRSLLVVLPLARVVNGVLLQDSGRTRACEVLHYLHQSHRSIDHDGSARRGKLFQGYCT